jgi:hypothetical protein
MSTDLERRLRDALHEDAQRARLVNPDAPPVDDASPLSESERPRRSVRALVAIAAAFALIVAAGAAVIQSRGGEPDVTTYSADPEEEDQALADDAVLTPADMPRGWVAAPRAVAERWQQEADDLDRALAECLAVDVSELRSGAPTAASGFVNSQEPNDERVRSEVTVFPSAAQARAVTLRYRDETAQRCYLDAIEQQIAEGARGGITTISGGELSGDEVQIGESTITEVFFEHVVNGSYRPVAADYVGFRIRVPLSSEGVEVDVFAVVAFATKGRVLVETSFQTYLSAFDGGSTTGGVAPQQATLLTKLVLNRISAADVHDLADAVDPSEHPAEEPLALPAPGEQPTDPEAAEE